MTKKNSLSDHIIEQFYESILEPACLKGGLSLLGNLLNCEHIALTAWNRGTDFASVIESTDLPFSCNKEFADYYHALDPSRNFMDGIEIGKWYIDHQKFGCIAMQRSAFYQDFLRRYDLGSINLTPILRGNTIENFLVVQHNLKLPLEKQRDPISIAHLLPHLQRAIKVRMHLEKLTMHVDLGSAIFSQLLHPTFVVDEEGKVFLKNDAAEQFLKKNRTLLCLQEKIQLTGMSGPKLKQLLRHACGSIGPASAGGVTTLDCHNGMQFQLIVTPLPNKFNTAVGPSHPLALVFIHNPQIPLEGKEELLKHLYDLSPAEARLTLALQNGADPMQAASQCGVSIATIRSQLRSIFRKTGTTRQSELIRTMSAIFIFKN